MSKSVLSHSDFGFLSSFVLSHFVILYSIPRTTMNTSDPRLNRRYFLKTSGLALAGVSSGLDRLSAAAQKRPGMKKALMFGMVKTEGTLLDKFRMLKEVGYDG